MATFDKVIRVVTHAISQELAMWASQMAVVATAASAPADGTPAAADAAWEEAQPIERATTARGLRQAAVRAAGEALRTGRDHVAAVRLLLSDPALAVPALAATRAAQDAVLPVLWLVDASATPVERAGRAAAHYLDYVQEHHKLLVHFSRVLDEAKEGASFDQVKEAQATLEKAGFSLRRHGNDSRYVVHVTLEGVCTPLKFGATAAASRYTPGLARQYTVASGATHARMWLTPGMRVGGTDTPAAIAMPIFDLSDYLADSLFSYVGLDPGPVHQKTNQRRIAIHEVVRPTNGPNMRLGYEEYALRREADAAPHRQV